MAASFGERALAEVHQEGLDQFYPASADKQLLLGVPVIDTLLEVFMPRTSSVSTDTEREPPNAALDEQIITEDEEVLLRCSQDDRAIAAEDLSESEFPSTVPSLGATTRVKRPSPVVEIASSLSGSGKTQLLYYIVARAILPRKILNVTIGGLETAVVWIDADHRLDVYRLRLVAQGILRDAWKTAGTEIGTVEITDPSVNDVLTSCLQQVHVFRPQSSSALLATLAQLEYYLYDLSQHCSASRPLHMIAIDSATAFLWQDKLRDEIARTDEIGRSHPEIEARREQKLSFYFSDLYTNLVTELKRLQKLFGCAVVYTTTVSGGRSTASVSDGPSGPYDRPSSQTPSLRPALPAPWGLFPTLRLVVHRDPVRPFPAAMSAHDARREASMRQDVVQRGRFSACVNAWGQEDWPRRVADSVHWHNRGWFSFYVRASGIEIISLDEPS
ncbi:hypothetical protein PDE_02089 [Penicillium oxalicum 114-2]|uniref:DNA recombination and repair protein Rad51-like C-terminal domain-containing protein n=1 Tax=Penicillium oxalicum (strain 114-2 / CGMCC 5302) TaxID=933388 RepID=S7ZEN4_PENO1|nr:hypothetical protein PDE_02089 [Penicillium oxalicum 114-2]